MKISIGSVFSLLARMLVAASAYHYLLTGWEVTLTYFYLSNISSYAGFFNMLHENYGRHRKLSQKFLGAFSFGMKNL